MPGTIKLLRGRVPRIRSSARYYSVAMRRKIIAIWRDQYEDAVIHIVPDIDPEAESKLDLDINFSRAGFVKKSWFDKIYTI